MAIFTLVLAALLQDAIPPYPWLPVKMPFLTAMALYAAVNRPLWMALVMAVWAGGLTDLLGGLPPLCTSTFLLLMYAAVRAQQRFLQYEGILHGALLTGAAALLQLFWTRAWLGGGVVFFSWRTLSLAKFALPAGMVAGLLFFLICGLTDRLSGLVKPVKDGNGIIWSENNR